MEPRELLTSNLALIQRVISFACRRHRFDPEEAEDFASAVHLKLIENEYAIVRAYESRCTFATYISVVVQRMALDYRTHTWGRWHASAEAKRLGPLAVDLEQLLRRDGHSFDQALQILAPRHEGFTPENLRLLADRLPERSPRHRDIALDNADSIAGARTDDVEEKVRTGERLQTSERLSSVMSAVIDRLADDDRLILQLRFEGGMSVAQIARALQLDQKLLYRRIERRMREIRTELEQSGMTPDEVLDLIGHDEAVLHFDLGKRIPRPSIERDERTTAHSEESQ
ncbi:MAG TPA: sigma-70 family RNA polymerase sigma factor [Thermoanaerobaculia bacterium]|nr:sigma-70 family RNA polymerase sigma factor [Thermoanaerobaculia bacterium]